MIPEENRQSWSWSLLQMRGYDSDSTRLVTIVWQKSAYLHQRQTVQKMPYVGYGLFTRSSGTSLDRG